MFLLPFKKPQRALRFLGTFLIALALFSLSGGHWALMQGIAWGRMIHEYSTQGSFSTAIGKTFDGKHACALCKKIERAQQQEKKNVATLDAAKKKEAIVEQPLSLLTLFPSSFLFSPVKKNLYSGPPRQPLLPPPRMA